MQHRTLYWLTDDLRFQDNPCLEATLADESLVIAYIVDPDLFNPGKYDTRQMGSHRWRFIHDSLKNLQTELDRFGQALTIVEGNAATVLARLATTHRSTRIIRATPHTSHERFEWRRLGSALPDIDKQTFDSSTLLDSETAAATFSLDASGFPATFSQFRRKVEPLPGVTMSSPIVKLPPPPAEKLSSTLLPPVANSAHENDFAGGEAAALRHLGHYFSSRAPLSYKETRNELEGWDLSTKFSPWLAAGNLSPRRILHDLATYEKTHSANESTYWISFELLWREYFKWYALAHGEKLFAFEGVTGKKPLTSFYSERFNRWRSGQTPWPLVNALMNQLSATGYMSNRGRQIVASCLVNELGVDWRAGAAHFQEMLIDYDTASNWGNWQYIAGVGCDPRGGRHFNIERQCEQYDPHGEFARRWCPDTGKQLMTSIDAVDAADWPILPEDSLPEEMQA